MADQVLMPNQTTHGHSRNGFWKNFGCTFLHSSSHSIMLCITKFYNDRIKTVDFLINIQLLIWFNFSSISLYLPKIPWTNGKNLSKRFFLSRKCGFPLIFQCKSYLPSALITTSWNPKSLPTFNSWPFNRDKNGFHYLFDWLKIYLFS